jgi:flagellar protein FlgJ
MVSVIDAAEFQFDNGRYALDSLAAGTAAGRGVAAGRDFSDFLRSDLSAGGDAGVSAKSKIFVDKKDKLYEQCEALETFLLKSLINGMRKTVEKSEFNKGGFAGEMYEDMLYDEYAKDFSKNAGFGFAELAYLELSGQRGKLMSRQGTEG